jgi:hypothetical protein
MRPKKAERDISASIPERQMKDKCSHKDALCSDGRRTTRGKVKPPPAILFKDH